MTKIAKLIERLLSVPKDLTFDELIRIFKEFGFEIGTKGKTSGSRLEFYHKELRVKYYVHKPHPKNIIKPYVVKQVIEFFKNLDLL
jgi:phage terminase large subunit